MDDVAAEAGRNLARRLDPTRGREQAGKRPAIVISADLLNASPAGLAIVLPITSKDKRIRSHVAVDPPEGELKQRSFIKCEDIRSVSVERFVTQWGTASTNTLAVVEDCLRILLGV